MLRLTDTLLLVALLLFGGAYFNSSASSPVSDIEPTSTTGIGKCFHRLPSGEIIADSLCVDTVIERLRTDMNASPVSDDALPINDGSSRLIGSPPIVE